MTRMCRRLFGAAVVGLFVASGAVLFAAGAAEQEDVGPPDNLTGVGHEVHQGAADGLVEEFLENTGVGRVEWQTFGIGEIHSTIMRQSALPSAPFDFGYVLNQEVDPRLLGRMEPLDPLVEEAGVDGFPEDFSAGMLEAMTHEGQLRGIPMRGVVDALHVNTELFERRGVNVPETYEELLDAASELTFEEDGRRSYGFSFHGTPSHISLQVINLARAKYPDRNDAGIITSDYRVVIDQQPAIEAIATLQELYADGVLHPDISTHTVDDVTRLYETGRLAMWIGNITNYDNFNDPDRSQTAGHSEVVAFPFTEAYEGDDVGYTSAIFWSFVIPENTENTEYAWELVRHLSSAESQLHSGLHNANQPTRSSVLAHEDYLEQVPYADLAAELTAASRVAWPPFEGRAQAGEIAGNEIIRAMHGDISPERAADNAAAQLRDLLREEGLLTD
jgi:multiple sugar transport system substrate-binding protein